jgi:hypothetical protein
MAVSNSRTMTGSRSMHPRSPIWPKEKSVLLLSSEGAPIERVWKPTLPNSAPQYAAVIGLRIPVSVYTGHRHERIQIAFRGDILRRFG